MGAHRDVKLSNWIFRHDDQNAQIQSHSPSRSRLRLVDFGMATAVDPRDGLLRGRCGTPGYVAPEILKAHKSEGYANNVDMFSLGVVAYTLLCGYEPFYGATNKELIRANRECSFEFYLPEWGK